MFIFFVWLISLHHVLQLHPCFWKQWDCTLLRAKDNPTLRAVCGYNLFSTSILPGIFSLFLCSVGLDIEDHTHLMWSVVILDHAKPHEKQTELHYANLTPRVLKNNSVSALPVLLHGSTSGLCMFMVFTLPTRTDQGEVNISF